jgi:hypothetical protein
MMRTMLRKTLSIGALVFAGILTGCGTSTPWPNGSKYTTQMGVAESGYPGGQPKDPGSPALASSTESQNSHEGPKVPEAYATKAPRNQPEKSREGATPGNPQ